jgi:hypothetical protein
VKKESLEKALNIIVNAIAETEIEITDRIELMLNLREFLKPTKYEENIKVLNKTIKRF